MLKTVFLLFEDRVAFKMVRNYKPKGTIRVQSKSILPGGIFNVESSRSLAKNRKICFSCGKTMHCKSVHILHQTDFV